MTFVEKQKGHLTLFIGRLYLRRHPCYKAAMGNSPAKTPVRRIALWEVYPIVQTLVVLAALALSAMLLGIGLSLPLVYTQQMVFWKSTYSVWAGVVALWEIEERALASLVFFFSIVFPIAKLVGLVIIWFLKLPETARGALLHWLGILGKWSMLDVFIVAILIVLVKMGPLVKVEPRTGVYVFASAIAASMLTTMYVDRLARKSQRPPSSTGLMAY